MADGKTGTEGFIPFREWRIGYRIVGRQEDPRHLPLLCLHGGPGSTFDYLEPLEALAAAGRQVIFYDQLGNGRSGRPADPSLWTVDLFLEELATVRRALGLTQVHLLGQSWGGMLAMEYAVTRPRGLASLVLADAPASTAQWVAEINRLRAELPKEVQAVLLRHEAAGTTADPAYQEAMLVFYRRHVCRLDPWPDCLMRTFRQLTESPEVYLTLWGPSEFHVTGTLKEWQVLDRLGRITTPTLVVGGRHDEATPIVTGAVHRAIAGSEWVLFEESSHMPHLEETPRFLKIVGDFLASGEAALPA
ncbi:MAG: proline iminopeptidase-family hydrolase [Deltaproteobacteria bacterium]|nr:proline iminopeptidase-family hydrolase [Deltaproteobacteria bacterium]